MRLAAGAHAALGGDGAMVANYFQDVGGFLENRGTKVDTHVHMIAFGYLALMLALLAPWTALSAGTKRHLAWLFLCGAGLLPLCVFLIHYVGLAYSPLKSIGWASIFADLGGLLVIVAAVGYLSGLVKHFLSKERAAVQDHLLADTSVPGRLLLAGGVFLLLLGSLILPVCVLLELNYGLVAGGLADMGGLLVIVALLAMWIGILRYTGRLDAGEAI